MRAAVVVMATCAACAGDDPPTLIVHAKDAALVVAQDGDGRWKQLALDSEGIARFEITSDTFGVGRICPPGPGVAAATFFFETTPRDVYLSCELIDHPIRVSGTVSPGSQLWIDGTVFGAATGTFTTMVSPGLHDVVAVSSGTPKRSLILRQIDMTADLVIDVPVATEGVEMRAVTPVVIGADPSQVMISADLNPRGEVHIFFGLAAATIHVPPSAQLLASDRAAIAARAGGCVVQHPLTDETPTFEIPGPVTASVSSTRVRWVADPAIAWDEARITFSGRDGMSGIDRVADATFLVSNEWLAARSYEDSFPLLDVSRMPGWTPALGGFAPGADLSFEVARSSGRYDGEYTGCSARGSFVW